MAEWNIQSRATLCAQCGAAFTPGASGHSLLMPTAEGTLSRKDVCGDCFRNLPAGTEAQAAAVWAFRVPSAAPGKPKEAPIQRETAEHLLRRLMAFPTPELRGAMYVLAILMERNRQFVERSLSVNAEGERVRLYEQRQTGDLFPIVDPGLSAEDLPKVQQQVLELLEHPERLPTETGICHAKPRRTAWHARRVQYRVLRKVFR